MSARSLFAGCSALLLLAGALIPAWAQQPEGGIRVVFQRGVSAPPSSLRLEGSSFVITGPAVNAQVNSRIPVAAATYVSGSRPPAIGNAIALILSGKDKEALALLNPVLREQAVTAKISGNFWVDAARAAAIALANSNEEAPLDALATELNSASSQGDDPIMPLATIIRNENAVNAEGRIEEIRGLLSERNPTVVNAWILYSVASRQERLGLKKEALQSYLGVSSLYPSGSMVINAAAEYHAAGILLAEGRRDEAILLLQSAANQCQGTTLAEQVAQRLTSAQ